MPIRIDQSFPIRVVLPFGASESDYCFVSSQTNAESQVGTGLLACPWPQGHRNLQNRASSTGRNACRRYWRKLFVEFMKRSTRTFAIGQQQMRKQPSCHSCVTNRICLRKDSSPVILSLLGTKLPSCLGKPA